VPEQTAGPAAASPLTRIAAGRPSVARPRETVRGGGRSRGRLWRSRRL